MFRGLLRLILVVALVVGVGAFFLGYRWHDMPDVDRPVGTSGIIDEEDKARARDAGAEIGETVATSADRAQRAAADASLTTKIKAKMALDDQVSAANIDIDTDGSVVTLSGLVSSAEERERALRLARETDGVTSVHDRLTVGN